QAVCLLVHAPVSQKPRLRTHGGRIRCLYHLRDHRLRNIGVSRDGRTKGCHYGTPFHGIEFESLSRSLSGIEGNSGSGACAPVFHGVRPLLYQSDGSDPEFRKRVHRRLTRYSRQAPSTSNNTTASPLCTQRNSAKIISITECSVCDTTDTKFF